VYFGVPGVNRGDTPESGQMYLKVGIQCVLFLVEKHQQILLKFVDDVLFNPLFLFLNSADTHPDFFFIDVILLESFLILNYSHFAEQQELTFGNILQIFFSLTSFF